MRTSKKVYDLNQVAIKAQQVFTFETTKGAAAKSLKMTSYMFDQKIDEAMLQGKTDSDHENYTQCAILYLKRKALKALSGQNTCFAEASIRNMTTEELYKAFEFKNKEAIQRGKEELNLRGSSKENDKLVQIIIWALKDDWLFRAFEISRQVAIYEQTHGPIDPKRGNL